MLPWILLAWAAVSSSIAGASRLTPPVLPLIVRNPYLSTWLADARHEPWSSWPIFWAGQHMGMSLMAHVPSTGNVYPLLGRPHDSLGENNPKNGYNVSYAQFLGSKYDASSTNLTYLIQPTGKHQAEESLKITVTFLSPITPTSTLRQSIPAAYVTVHVEGNMNVNIYMDMNGEWVTGDRGSALVWKMENIVDAKKEKALYQWQVSKKTEQLLTEYQDRSEWGSLHFLAPQGVRYESGTSMTLRTRFARTGVLQNMNDERFRTVMDDEPVFAYAKPFILNGTDDKPNVDIINDEVTFTIAHIQDPVVQFASARGLTLMKPLWKSWFPDVKSLLYFHFFDFNKAKTLVYKYSDQLARDAQLSAAEDYVDIVALSARQVLGATSFSGTAENPILFLKEISSNGNCQTVDVIFPSFPFFLYTNPRWLAYLLEPLIEHMLSGQYPNNYSMHDLGTHFPNMTGHPDGKDEYMPVEECGNMLLMGLAIVNSLRFPPDSKGTAPWYPGSLETRAAEPDAGLFPLRDLQTVGGIDKLDSVWGVGPDATNLARKWVDKSYRLWRQWTGYLVEFSLEPHNQLSTDDFAGWLALQTNLALKGIVGINAMSEMANFVGKSDDYKYFKNISDTYITKWEGFGFSRDGTHAKLSYDWYGSWTTLYNMFADALLCFHLDGTEHDTHTHKLDEQKPITPPPGKVGFIPRRVYEKQSKWYGIVRQKYGLPLDSRHLYAKTDWEFFAMAVSSPSVRGEILQSVAKWVNETATDRALTDLHKTEEDGGFPGPNFFARPVVGGHFAFLALEKACNGKATEGLKFLDKVDNSPADDDWEGPEDDGTGKGDSQSPIEDIDGSHVKLGDESQLPIQEMDGEQAKIVYEDNLDEV
ncbi:glutaminase [Arthroderma uncinatum]|uniref:glutaminase n=1 Tax=Arthroderma uncinatum TaxID=74035 RepID=UPI00144A8D36|nr:glutaminase [Arthroderma uncinatum]KAF3491576.1 glutaminase [Arthroderma uncinatum]